MTKILNIAAHLHHNLHHLHLSRPTARKLLLTLIVVIMGVNAWGWNGEDPAWSAWTGTTIVNNTFYYLFTKNQNRFLKDNNQGLGYYEYGDNSIPKWRVENLSGIVFNLTSENNLQFILSAKSDDSGWFGTTSYWIEPSTNLTNIAKENNDAKLKSDINGGYRTIYRSEQYHDKYRNVKSISDGIGIEMQKNASAEWLFVTESDYNNAAAQYYLYNVGTGQFLAFYNNGTDVKTYVTNDPSQASLVTILTKYINGEDKKSYIKAELNGTSYYMYHSKGDNTQYTSNDKFFTISSKTIGTTSGYQLILKNGDNYNRYARAGYGGFLENRSYSALDFPKDDDNNLNTLWLFISQEQYNSAAKTKLAPVHVPFTYDRYMFYDGEVTTHEGAGKWDYTVNRVWLNAVKDTFDIHFDGIPETLSFEYRPKTAKGALIEDRRFMVLESADGIVWSEPIFTGTNNSSDQNMPSGDITLEPTSRYLRFCIDGCTAAVSAKENLGGCFYNINVTEHHQFETDRPNVNFGVHGKNDGIFEEYIAFSHANAKGVVTVEKSGTEESSFVVEPLTITAGKDIIRTDYVKVSFVGKDVKTHNATLTFSDGTTSVNVTLIGERINNHVPVFTWNPRELPYYYDDSIPFVFSSNTSESLAPIVINNGSTSDIAKLVARSNGSYTLVIGSKPEVEQQVSIVVMQVGRVGDTIQSVTETYKFTPRPKPSLSVPFKITKTHYEESFSAGHYFSTNNEGDRKLLWVDSEAINKDGAAQNDKDWYAAEGEFLRLGGSSNGPFSDPVTGSKAWDDKYIWFEFTGQPDSIFFRYKTDPWATYPDWYVLESPDGEGDPMTWSKAWYISSNTPDDALHTRSKYEQASIALKPSTRFICLCYSGNYCAHFQDITVTGLDGIYYLRDEEGHYLSRGGDGGTKAVIDEYGIAVRKTRKTTDNTNKYTRFQYMDQFTQNAKFMGQSGENVVTNTLENINFTEEKIAETETFKLRISGSVPNGLPDKAWFLEEVVDHPARMQQLKDAQAIGAAAEFKEDVPSVAILRQRLRDNDYAKETITLDAEHNVSAVSQLYEGSGSDLPAFSIRVDEGLYHISMKAFNRICDNDNAYKARLNGYDNAVAYVYAKNGTNEQHTQLCSVYESSENSNYQPSPTEDDPADYMPRYGMYFPNGVTAAGSAFNDANRYENDVFIYVRPDGNPDGKGLLEYGLRSPSNGECANWVCYRDFTIIRYYRKEYVFDGADAANNNWSNASNWLDESGGRASQAPLSVHRTRIEAPVIVDDASAAANTIIIVNDGDKKGEITINPDAALAVGEGGIVGATKDNLVLKANSDGQTGALRLYPGTEAPEAKVEFYSTLANDPDGDNWKWQYIGSPITQETALNNEQVFYNCWLYKYDSEHDSWSNAGNWEKMKPFRAYAFTRNNGNPGKDGSRPSMGPLFAYSGRLNAPVSRDTLLYYVGGEQPESFIANSWTAPIAIKNFVPEDFENVSQTIYIYRKEDLGNVESAAINTAEYTDNDVIPAMQGFSVKAMGANAKLTLDYKRLVWDSEVKTNGPMKAPARGAGSGDTDLTSRVCVNLMSGDSIPDRIFLLEKEGEGFSRAYTEGYDAPKYIVDGLPCIYTYETDGKHLAVSATDSVLGTYLAINTNSSQTYTLSFSKVIGEGLGLRDLVTDTVIPIADSVSYMFTAPANMTNQLRFVVEEYVASENGNVSTAIGAIEDANIRIWNTGDVLVVSASGVDNEVRLYDAAGRLIMQQQFGSAASVNLSSLPGGVYVAVVNNMKAQRILK